MLDPIVLTLTSLPYYIWVALGVAFLLVMYVFFSGSKKRGWEDDSEQGHREKAHRPKAQVTDLSSLNRELNRIVKFEEEIDEKLHEIGERQVKLRADIRRELDAIKAALAEIRKLMPATPAAGGSPSDLRDRTPGNAEAPAADVQPAAVAESPQPAEPEPSQPPVNPAELKRQTLESLVAGYNENPQGLKRRFDVREFTVANMQTMGKEQGAKPIYRLVEPGQGEYWLIALGEEIGYAVPRYKQTYNLGQFRSAGMDRVFTCKGFIEGQRYRKVEVVKPARFCEVGHGELEMVEQGILELGQGEKEP